MAVKPAKILSQRSYLVPGKFRITEHFFQVPLDYSRPEGQKLVAFARSARKHDPPVAPEETSASSATSSIFGSSSTTNSSPALKRLPWLVYFQGGPGFECRSPQNTTFTHSFTEKGYEVLLLDQRGTGLSNAFNTFGSPVKDTRAVAENLKHYRADSIVRDAEAIRLALTQGESEEQSKWSTLGQSFGGFCTTTYLSLFPRSLRECFITGGLPPLVNQPDEVYRRLFKKVVERNEAYYKKYPEDVAHVKSIVRCLNEHDLRLPSGQRMTARRFLQLGLGFGFHGGLDSVHEIVLKAATELKLKYSGHISRQTLNAIAKAQSFDDNLLYAILHEPLYCQGNASNWSAERILRSSFPGFDPARTLDLPDQATYFTGEMIFPFMFDDGIYSELPALRDVANQLATDSSWPSLYDRKQLSENTVPVYAAIYMDDMYVDFEYSLETARAIRGCKTFVTNRLYHNALGSKTEQIFEELWKLRCDTID